MDRRTVSPVDVALGACAYVVLVVLDLATTSVLLKAYPNETREGNGLLARALDAHGIPGLWAWKLAGAGLAIALYLAVRARYSAPGARRVADAGLVAMCVVQAAIVLVNLAGFRALVGATG